MKKDKKIIAWATVFVLILIAVIVLFPLLKNDNIQNSNKKVSVEKAIDSFSEGVKNAKYNNLVFHDFDAPIDQIESVHNIKVNFYYDYWDKPFIENFNVMKKIMDDFFEEDFDKSFINMSFDGEDDETVMVEYNDIEKKCSDDKTYNTRNSLFLFGNNTSDGGYMVQMSCSLGNIWFSKNGFGEIHPSSKDYKKVYSYISCKRQVDDADINLMDGRIKLSEIEANVLLYLDEKFPLRIKDTNISFGIGDIRIIGNGEYDGVCVKIRRVYKGIPFEYGSNSAVGMYIDKYESDGAEIDYVEATHPDTILGFSQVNGNIEETQNITEMIPVDEALRLLSERIGNNSVYDVYGVELVYRETTEYEEKSERNLFSELKPVWKIITINQNDNKYTLFYVDVVTGEITERFEYYYE